MAVPFYTGANFINELFGSFCGAKLSFLLYPRAWKVWSSICSLPTSASLTKLRVGRANGRTGWLKADGNEVHFICFEEQLSVVGRDVTIYFVGELSQQLKRFNQKWTKLRR